MKLPIERESDYWLARLVHDREPREAIELLAGAIPELLCTLNIDSERFVFRSSLEPRENLVDSKNAREKTHARGIEWLHLFLRRDKDPLAPFPFLIRAQGCLWKDFYYQTKSSRSRGVGPPPHGSRLEVAVHTSQLSTCASEVLAVLLEKFQGLAVSMSAVYGYAGYANRDEVFSGVSQLELDLGLIDERWDGRWVDAYRRRSAGVFEWNYLGAELTRRVWDKTQGSLHQETGGEEYMVVNAEGGDLAILAAVTDLAPKQVRVSQKLQAPTTERYLISPMDVQSMGGVEFLRNLGFGQKVVALDSGAAIIEKLNETRSDRHPAEELFWTLRPRYLEYWDFGPRDTKRWSILRVPGAGAKPRSKVSLYLDPDSGASGAPLQVELQMPKERWRKTRPKLLKSLRGASYDSRLPQAEERQQIEVVFPLKARGLAAILGLVELLEAVLPKSTPILVIGGDMPDEARSFHRGWLQGERLTALL